RPELVALPFQRLTEHVQATTAQFGFQRQGWWTGIGQRRLEPDTGPRQVSRDSDRKSQQGRQGESGYLAIHDAPLETTGSAAGATCHKDLPYWRPVTTALVAGEFRLRLDLLQSLSQ